MTGRALTRAIVAGVALLAILTLALVLDAKDAPEPAPTGTTAPRSVP